VEGAEAALGEEAVATTQVPHPNLQQPQVAVEAVAAARRVEQVEVAALGEVAEELPVGNPIDSWEAQQL
jgi:hypothetical protein